MKKDKSQKYQEQWQKTRRVVIRRESWRNDWKFWLLFIGLLILLLTLRHYHPTVCLVIAGLATVFLVPHLVMMAWNIFANCYRVQEDKLIIRKGVLFHDVIEIPLQNIEDIKIEWGSRILRTGTLYIVTKDTQYDHMIYGISDPDELKEHIFKIKGMHQEMSPNATDSSKEKDVESSKEEDVESSKEEKDQPQGSENQDR